MPKIAIIEVVTNKRRDEDGENFYEKMVDTITDWEDVTDKDYTTICNALRYNEQYRIIVFPNQQEIKRKVIADFLEAAKIEEQKQADREAANQKRQATLRAKKAEREKRKLEKLAAEQGMSLVPTK